MAFYYRQTNNHADADTLDDKIENGIYFINNSKFYRRGQVLRKPDKAGDSVVMVEENKMISDFTLIIKECRQQLDGKDGKAITTFRCEARAGVKSALIELSSAAIQKEQEVCAAVLNVLHSVVSVTGNFNDFKRAMAFFNESKIAQGFDSPGWQLDNSVYVTPSTIITKDEVQTNNKYFITETYSAEIGGFDFCILKDEDKKNLFRIISEYLLNATEPAIAMSMLGYAAYSIIEPIINGHLQQNRFALFISGPSGRGKSYIATLYYHLFGNFTTCASWTSTVNSLNQMGHYLNGGMFLVDDFKDQNITLGKL